MGGSDSGRIRGDVIANTAACAAGAERCGIGIGHLPRRHGNQFCAVLVADVGCLAIGRRQERLSMKGICCCCCSRWRGVHGASSGHGGAERIAGGSRSVVGGWGEGEGSAVCRAVCFFHLFCSGFN